MKKTQGKDAFRNIRKRIVSYLSICLVIMLGLGGVFITRYMGAGINAEATKYYKDHGFKHFEIISSLGITQDDINQIKEAKGVTDAEGVIRSDATFTKGSLKKNIELISMTERISVPEVIEGNAPAAKDECMVAEDFALVCDLKVGDKVHIVMPNIAEHQLSLEGLDEEADAEDEETAEETVEEEPEPEDEVLFTDTFTITGIMKHPDYLRRKSIDVVALPIVAYDKEVTSGYFTHAFVKAEDPEGVDIFDDDYFDETAGTKNELEKLTATLAEDSATRAKQKAYDQIDIEWANALAEFDDAQNQIDSGEAELNSKLKDARNKLNSAQAKLDREVRKYTKQINDGEKKVKKAKKTLKDIDKKLPAAEKYIKEMKAEYDGELKDSLKTLAQAQKWIDMLDKLDVDSEEYKQTAKALADFIIEQEATIRKVHDFFSKPEVMDIAKKLKEVTGIDATKTVTAIKNLNVDELLKMANAVSSYEGDIKAFVDEVKSWVKTIQDTLKDLEEFEKSIKSYKANRKSLYKLVADKEKEIAAARKELAAKKKKYQAEIRNGWSMYYSEKSKYEQKLAEAKELLEENREKAEEKLEEAKAEVEKIECKCLLFDRRANAGYVDVKSNLAAVASAGDVFGLLFMLISAIVCFSTLAIIIEEQKKMVGTVKAFGFFKKEVLGKYLVFGVSAAVIGCIAGMLLALGLSGIVLKAYDSFGLYQFGLAKSIVTWGPTIIASLIMIAICAIATIIACADILKSPASLLMKGETAKKGGSGHKESSSGKGGSLYSKLIIRNMLDDKARVVISILIIAFSTMLVGTGLSMKLAFDGMSNKQIEDIYKYDVRVDLGKKVTDDDKKKIEDVMTQDGAEYMSASYETHIFKLGDRLDALYILTGNAEKLPEYFAINDAKTGEQLELPKDGVLVQLKMEESYGMETGTQFTALDSSLDEKSVSVKGVFNNYVGRLAITSPEGYRKTFNEDPTFNCYYVKTGTADTEKLMSDISAVNEDVSFEIAKEFVKKFEPVSLLYNLIVYVTTGIAILMSFMILSNLVNIFLNRKKTELTVMRINGFSIKQTRGYLSKETIVTNAAGLILGVLGGAVAAPIVIKTMEQPDLQFVRTFHPTAWIAAVVMEALFALIINGFVFRKVKDLDFRDVA